MQRSRRREHGAPKLWARRSRVSAAPISHPFYAITLEAWGFGSPGDRRATTPGIRLLSLRGRSQGRWGKTCFGSLPSVRPRSPNQTHSSPLGPDSSLRRGTRVGHGGTRTSSPSPEGARMGFGLCHSAWGGRIDPLHLLRARRRSGSRDDLRCLPCLTAPPPPFRPPWRSWPTARPGKALFCQRGPSECAEKSLLALMRVHTALQRGG